MDESSRFGTQEETVAYFDRLAGLLKGIPDVTESRPSTVVFEVPVIGRLETWIISTMRHREQGDYVFLQRVSAEGSIRIVLPPKVTETMNRQRDALTGKVRSKIGRAQAAERKRLGIQPGFFKGAAASIINRQIKSGGRRKLKPSKKHGEGPAAGGGPL